jgi:hypothetical protein
MGRGSLFSGAVNEDPLHIAKSRVPDWHFSNIEASSAFIAIMSLIPQNALSLTLHLVDPHVRMQCPIYYNYKPVHAIHFDPE